MAQLNNQPAPLLTIAIPTYNRGIYLKRCLTSLFLQAADFDNKIEIIISDNASNDSTKEVVENFNKSNDNIIQYIRNSENIGPDRNIGRCYLIGVGKYVLAVGDDDVFLPGAIKFILSVLPTREWGVVFLNFYPFKTDPEKEQPDQRDKNSYIYNKGSIIKHILSNVSFISTNIVNRKFISEIDINKTTGTNFTQVPGVLNAIINSEENLFINRFFLAQQSENSGGYKYFTIFGKNFPGIIIDFLGERSKETNWVLGYIMMKLLPYQIVQLRKGTFSKDLLPEDNPYEIIKPYFKRYYNFWLIIFPLFKLPAALITPYYFFVRAYVKIIYFFSEKHKGEIYYAK